MERLAAARGPLKLAPYAASFSRAPSAISSAKGLPSCQVVNRYLSLRQIARAQRRMAESEHRASSTDWTMPPSSGAACNAIASAAGQVTASTTASQRRPGQYGALLGCARANSNHMIEAPGPRLATRQTCGIPSHCSGRQRTVICRHALSRTVTNGDLRVPGGLVRPPRPRSGADELGRSGALAKTQRLSCLFRLRYMYRHLSMPQRS